MKLWTIQVDSADEIKIFRLEGCHHDYVLRIGGHSIYLTKAKLAELGIKINENGK